MNASRKMLILIILILVLLFFVYQSQAKNGAASKPLGDKLKDCSIPRGIRNNNPGNIVINPANAWRGKIPEELNTDFDCNSKEVVQHFEQFETYEHGIRAMAILLRNYINRGHDTVRLIVYKYAPSHENPTSDYVEFVAHKTRFEADAPLSPDKKTLSALVKAMAYFENGRPAVSDTQFNKAWEMI